MDIGAIKSTARAPSHQKFRPPRADRIASPASRRRRARLIVQLRKCENFAPGLPCGRNLVGVGADAQGNGERGVAVLEHKHLAIVAVVERDPDKVADTNAYGHPHAVNGTAQHDVFAMKFDQPDAAVRADVVRAEDRRQRKRVEPQCAARPGGIDPACCCLTPHGFCLPPGLCSRSIGETLAGARPFPLKNAG